MTTPNGTWSSSTEKGTILTTTSRFERLRKNRLLLAVVTFTACMFILITATGAAIYFYYIPQAKKSSATDDPCDKMLCTYGSQCLVDETTHRAYCICDEACSDVFAPVCGDDGVTYSSECQLRLSACSQQRRIYVQRQGACADVQDPCETTECRFGSFCSTSLDGRTARCVCPEDCVLHRSDQTVVCGTDGRNYQNICELRRASCRQMREIEVKFDGVCDPCDGVECSTSQVCQLDEKRNPICRCNSVCSPDFRPVCGSDGKTYTNECTLRVEACKSRKNIRIIYTGECSSGANPCDSLQCSPYQDCDIDRHGKATCQCDDTCEKAVRLVCGSDDVTYMNECEMKRQGCLLKKSIRLAYRGECGERGPCYRYHCSFGALCVLRANAPTCECPSCTEEFEPVCGTDGISYTNNCKLKREACEQKSEIAVAYSGLCTGCENKRCEYYAVCESDGRGNGKCVCPQTCIKVESLVCGTDEVTYQNECEMRIEACRKAQYVMVVSKGPCDLCQHVQCNFGARCEEGKCVCPTDCPKVSETVCANDGVTYKNECEMRHAACLHDQELNMLFYGECDEAGESQDEGSGAEMDCEERTCKYGGVCEYNFEGIPHCVCPLHCPQTLDPVCGSDGKLYDNECKLKEESCNLQKNVMPVHIEMCEEFREVPCAGETPLVDPATNKDYYCGDGMGSKLCPPGSYCHKSSAFSKCCREVVLVKTCSESSYGCCPDGRTSAQGPHSAGCPSICNCNRLGSFGLTCDPVSNQCFCKPGVGGPRCDRCEPGYWGLHKITEDTNDGCTPCTCNLYGSVRDDCEQMTGRCVCKPAIQGMKCDICPVGTILGPDGCMDESIAQRVSGSCDDLACYHGAECRETEDYHVQCKCDFKCSTNENADLVCGSDGNTYASECQMKLFSCRYQRTIAVTSHSACPKDLKKNHTKVPLFLKRSAQKTSFRKTIRLQNHSVTSRSKREKYHLGNRKVKSVFQRSSPPTKNVNVSKSIFIDVEFTTNSMNGVIFYCGNGYENDSTYFLLNIRNHHLELWFKGINVTTVLKSTSQISDRKSHLVSFKYFPQFIVIYLDRKWTGMSSITENIIPAKSFRIFLGSVPEYLQRKRKDAPELLPFNGCFHTLKMSLNFMQSLEIYPFQPPKKGTKELLSCGRLHVNIEKKKLSADERKRMDMTTSLTPAPASKVFFTWIERSSTSELSELNLAIKNEKLEMNLFVNGELLEVRQHHMNIDSHQTHKIRIFREYGRTVLYLNDALVKGYGSRMKWRPKEKKDLHPVNSYKHCKSKIHIQCHECTFKFLLEDSTVDLIIDQKFYLS